MKMTGRFSFIRMGALNLLEFKIHGNSQFEQKMISLEEILDQDKEFTNVLNKQKCILFFAPFVW